MADIFISYAREDRDLVEQLAGALEANGLTVWWDRNISGGAEFSMLIEEELNAASHVIVAWSSSALGSHWVRDEAELAREQSKLIPLSLDGVMPPLGFRQLHALDFDNWRGDVDHQHFQELLVSIGPSKRLSTTNKNSPQAYKKPGIAVLPFDNMSTDNEIEHIADGLTEDIISSLATIRHLNVPARNSTFVFKGQSIDLREVGEALNVRYVIEGSVRKLGPRLRVTAQFIETTTGNHLWANKFDVSLDEFYANPDDVVEKICGAVFSILIWVEADRSESLPESELGPWECCQRTAALIGKGAGGVANFERAMKGVERAVEIAPDYALAHAMLAWGRIAAVINGVFEDGDEGTIFQDFLDHLKIARQLADGDLLVTMFIGACENFMGEQEQAVQTLEGVLKRNPSLGMAWHIICMNYAYLGRFDEARGAIERAEEVAPEGGFSPGYNWFRGSIEYVAGEYGAALSLIERSVLQNPEYGYANILLAFCFNNAGKTSAARKAITQAKKYNPQLRPEKIQPIIMSQPDKDKAAREYALLVDWWG